MGMIIFFVLSIAACVFLIYVLVRFHREVTHLEMKSSMHSLTYLGSYQNELLVPESSFSVSREQQPRDQLAARQGMLAGGALALVGLFAPLVFVKLLQSPSIWHR